MSMLRGHSFPAVGDASVGAGGVVRPAMYSASAAERRERGTVATAPLPRRRFTWSPSAETKVASIFFPSLLVHVLCEGAAAFWAVSPVVAITAEPGGDDAVRARLTERKVPTLDFEVRSDPEHNYVKMLTTSNNNCSSNGEDVFVIKDHDWNVSGPYKMIQPALERIVRQDSALDILREESSGVVPAEPQRGLGKVVGAE